MLAHRGGLGGHRQLHVEVLDGGGELVGTQAIGGDPTEPVLELGVVGQGLGGVHRHDRHVHLEAQLHPLHGRPGPEDVAQLAPQLGVAHGVIRVLGTRVGLEQFGTTHGPAEILPELALGGLEEDVAAVGGLVELVAHPIAHAGGAGCPTLVVVRRVAGDLVLRSFVGLPRLAAQPVHGRRGIALGDLQPAALTGGSRLDHPGQHTERPEHGAGVDPHRRMLGDGGEPVIGDLGLHQTGPHVVGDTVTRQVRVGAGHAVAGDGAEHDAGVDLSEAVVAQTPSFQAAGPHGLDDHVGASNQIEVGLHALGGAQVEHQRSLAPVHVEVHQRHPLHDGPGHLPDVVARGGLDLDHLGAEVGQRRGDRGRAEHRALDDANAGERTFGCSLVGSGVGHLSSGGRVGRGRVRVGRSAAVATSEVPWKTRTRSRLPTTVSDGSSG